VPAIEIARLDHVVLRVANLDRALAFYCDALGCVEERRIDELGLVQLRAGASLIDLVPVDSPLGRHGGGDVASDGRNVDHFALELLAFDEPSIRAELQRRGIEAGETGERYGARGTGPSIYLKDPDGNTVELKGPATRPAEVALPPGTTGARDDRKP
jgi:catechol 2,3-dioxygenase-like lactoylglutathione lyase family enzyme